ncbi:MAG: GTPase HflX [Candidatus Krumholzibacteria bacterium]|nr:GTPase HflX [Candidatus Krumholzibacteria bacterium]
MAFYVTPPDHPEERACLVGVRLRGVTEEDVRENLGELEQLVATAGAEVVAVKVQKRARIDGSTYIGTGILESLATQIEDEKINVVIFDDELTPAQARNIESRLKVNVIDRTELILDIFSRRARTKQARIQVEIAQLEYALPRLKRLWDHLSRQSGGIGTRGPGETQLEVDRRRVRERISHLKKDLDKINKQTSERRKKRREAYNVTIVGYTNAGKSTLLNMLSGSSVLESEKLFSTLDSTSRRVPLAGMGEFVLTDTIGFIRKLPTHLVASFRATLMDVEDADMLIHLVDVSSSGFEERIGVVNDVLKRVLDSSGGRGKTDPVPTLLVLNKVDMFKENAEGKSLANKYPDALQISAATGEGIDELRDGIKASMKKEFVEAELKVSSKAGKLISRIEKLAKVLDRKVEGEMMIYRVMIRRRDLGRLESTGDIVVKLARR